MGGRAGYNQISWDGRTLSGPMVGNGIHIMQMWSQRDYLAKYRIVVGD
jgi:hypothetical protein